MNGALKHLVDDLTALRALLAENLVESVDGNDELAAGTLNSVMKQAGLRP